MKGKKEKEGSLPRSFKADSRLPRAGREGKGCAQTAVRAAGRAVRAAPAPGQRQAAGRIGQAAGTGKAARTGQDTRQAAGRIWQAAGTGQAAGKGQDTRQGRTHGRAGRTAGSSAGRVGRAGSAGQLAPPGEGSNSSPRSAERMGRR